MSRWRQRVGGRQSASGNAQGTGIWGRIEGESHRPNAAVSTALADVNSDIIQVQAGLDRALAVSDSGALVAGVSGHYRKTDTGVGSLFGNGNVDISGYGLGATFTWYGAGGLYVDGQAQFTWYNADLRSTALGELADDNDGTGRAFSIESGQQIGTGATTFTPQAQLVYSRIDFDRFTDPNGAVVSSDKGESLRARIGVSIDHALGAPSQPRGGVYGLVNVSYEILNGTRTGVSGALLSHRDNRVWGELGVGGNYGWGNLSIFGEASVNSAFKDLGDSYSVKGQMGMRVKF
jgi:fibronectin-binding autotransporter adhesin